MENLLRRVLHPNGRVSRHPGGAANEYADAPPPALVTLHVWGVPWHHVPTAVGHMALDPRAVRSAPGVLFSKSLGTADGGTFAPSDTDPRHWGLLVCWERPEHAARFEHSRTARAWHAVADETLRVELTPLSSRGTWAGRAPFGSPAGARPEGPVASITRARIRPSMLRRFHAAVPSVAADLTRQEGLLLALGVGEAPVALQGTFSIWASDEELRTFAHRGAPHRGAITATTELGWYSEELFARFAVQRVDGTYRGRPVALPGVRG